MRLHHIGIATSDIAREIENVRKFHEVVSVSDTIFDKEQEASLCIISTKDGTDIELISGKPVMNLVAKGVTYYHICYETDNLEKEVHEMVSKGAILVSAAKPAVLFNNRRVAFLFLPYGVIELLERQQP